MNIICTFARDYTAFRIMNKKGNNRKSQISIMSFFTNSRWPISIACASFNSFFIASSLRDIVFLKDLFCEDKSKSGEISKLGLKIQPILICVL